MDCVVELSPRVLNGKGAIFWGIATDSNNESWSVRAVLGENLEGSPYRWTANVAFLRPEAETSLGAEFVITNGRSILAHCKVTKRL